MKPQRNDEKVKIFLSYASEDREQVEEIHSRLLELGFKPWMDKVDLLPGQNWEIEIRNTISTSDFVIVFLSSRSIEKHGYVQKEFRLALDEVEELPEGKIFVIPVRLDECEVPQSLRRFHWCDIFEENGFEKIIKSIQISSVERVHSVNVSNESVFHLSQKETEKERKEDSKNKSRTISEVLRIYQSGSPAASWVFGGALIIFLFFVVFFLEQPTNFQKGIIRFLLALTGALLSLFFVGGILLKGKMKGLVIGAGGGFAIFILIQFIYNPFPESILNIKSEHANSNNNFKERRNNSASELANINRISFWGEGNKAQFVMELDRKPNYRVFSLKNPRRIVVDVPDSVLLSNLPKINRYNGIIKNVRAGIRDLNDNRFVLDVDEKIKYHHYLVAPNKLYNYRVIFDLYIEGENSDSVQEFVDGREDILVAVDPGHGGEDPGEIYRNGAVEKDISLQLAEQLGLLIDKEEGMRSLLTRTGDYYIGLVKRLNIVRKAKADLLITIHTGKPQNNNGIIYVHSKPSASSEAAKSYAKSENQSDLIGGIELASKDDVLASVLLDLQSLAVARESMKLAGTLKSSFDRNEILNVQALESGNFKVLTPLDFPSILVNIPFYSSSYGANDISSKKVQNRIAAQILDGIRAYLGERKND